MEWKSEEEKEFKLKYAEAYQTLTPGYMMATINQRYEDLSKFYNVDKIIDQATFVAMKTDLLNKKRWVEEVDAEIAEAMKTAEVEPEMTAEQVAKEFSAKKVKASLKDIRE